MFQPGERPWIRLEGAEASRVAEVVRRCPTGALHYEALGDLATESPETVNTVQVSRGGPLYVRGRIRILTGSGEVQLEDVRVALCRCGDSRNRPFCDGSHFQNGFDDRGDVFEGGMKRAAEVAGPNEALRVTPSEEGPLELRGPMRLRSADGNVSLEGDTCNLCRCGGSRNKPFCDGTHRTRSVR